MKYSHARRLPSSRAASNSRRGLTETATHAERVAEAALRAVGERPLLQFVVRTSEAPTGFYVVDIALPKRNLLIELDGQPHATETGHWNDRLRTEAIERAMPRWNLIRFWNADITADADMWARFVQTY